MNTKIQRLIREKKFLKRRVGHILNQLYKLDYCLETEEYRKFLKRSIRILRQIDIRKTIDMINLGWDFFENPIFKYNGDKFLDRLDKMEFSPEFLEIFEEC